MIKRFLLFCVMSLVFVSPALASSSLGLLKENVSVGRTISIGLNPSSSGNWYIGPNNNSAVASGSISSGSLLIYGKAAGTASLSVCADVRATDCLEVNVIVSAPGQVLGAVTEAPHPANSWVLSGQTVFYVNANGLIPITTWKIFLNNGGKQSLIQPANAADLSLPLQALMTLKDSRVAK